MFSKGWTPKSIIAFSIGSSGAYLRSKLSVYDLDSVELFIYFERVFTSYYWFKFGDDYPNYFGSNFYERDTFEAKAKAGEDALRAKNGFDEDNKVLLLRIDIGSPFKL